LAAAVTLARAGLRVQVYEGAPTPGGGCRTEALTLPGFAHDVCSAVHPMLVASPFFASTDLAAQGVRLCTPPVAFAHPLDGGRAAAVMGSIDETAASLGTDGPTYRRLIGRLVPHTDPIMEMALSPLRAPPRHPLAVAPFGLLGLLPARTLARRFTTDEGQAMVAGVAAHAMRPLSAPLTGAFALVLATLAQAVGWPVVQGGSAKVADALAAELESLDGTILTGRWIRSLDELPQSKSVLLDVTPGQLLDLAGSALPARRRRALRRFEHGPGICKVDWALTGPVPWEAEVCRRTATVHVAGTLADVVACEAEVAAGRHPARPYCIVAQPGVVDPTRAPDGQQTLWAYCHVPAGSTVDMTARIEAQIERFAPGFRDTVLARTTTTADQVAAHNPNYVGGDISGGSGTIRQTVARPTLQWNPYRTGIEGVYLCSASTPPGGGVHGMCGMHAARTVLRDLGWRDLGTAGPGLAGPRLAGPRDGALR
jgi:phytoene dehydrogenase-like protein